MTDLSIRTRLALLMAFLLISMAAAAGFALVQLRGVTLSIETVYADRVLPLLQLRAVSGAYVTTLPHVVERARDGRIDATTALADLDRTRREARAQWARYQATYLVPQEKALIAEAQPLLARADALHERLATLLNQGDREGLRLLATQELYPVVQALDGVLDRLVATQEEEAAAETAASTRAYRAGMLGLFAMLGLALAVGAALAWTMMLRYARERRAGEEAALHQAHCFAALSRTNQMIVRVREPAVLFEEICRICVETGLARIAYVLELEGNTGRVAGAAGPADALLAGVLLKLKTEGPMSRVPVAQALHEGQHVISNDYLHDERTIVMHERAREQGIRAMGAFPIRRGGAVVGALSLYVDQVGFFDEARVRLLDEMTGDLSFALDNIERDRARVHAEQQVEGGYERMRQVFNMMPVAILVISRKTGLIVEANATAANRYGIAVEAMVGHSMLALGIGLSPIDRKRFYDELEARNAVHELEVRVRTVRGEDAWLLTSAELIDYQGETCMLTVSLEITERKRREQADRDRVDAETSSRAKTDFLSRMSHELRTPLNAVLGFSQLMQSDAADPLSQRQRLRVESIRQAGWHLLALINDVLDVSRIESGHLRVESRGVALATLLDEVTDLVRAQADQAGVCLETPYRTARPVVVQGDPLRLRQVMLNLLSNAVKYNRPGGSVRVTVQEAADAQAVITITDTGLGMTRSQLDRLFEPFNRLGREHSDIEGTGIGLVLTRQLLTLMQGRLDIDSEAGRGTTVQVTLPHGEALSQRGELDAGGAGDAGPAGAGLPQGVVLYIEDNPINLLLVEQLLLAWPDVQLVQAEDGRRGIELARALRPDLVLLDMRLPDLDGPQVLEALRADPATRELRVVALSASAMPEEVARARASGAFDYWTKPLDFERFMADLMRLLASAVRRG